MEITGSYVNPKNHSEVSQKTLCNSSYHLLLFLVVGFFNFARCVRKGGNPILPHQIGLRLSEDIEVKVSLKEKYKFGGYRCITLKVTDTKGGDFVENGDLSMLVVETKNNTVVTEIGKEMPLTPGPDGLHKKVEIGVNNYSPVIFLAQTFRVYFLRDTKEYSQQRLGGEQPMSEMLTERDIL